MESTPSSLTENRIIKTWLPLALSWLLMSVELPALSAVVARLADPKINLASYGGVVFPLALIIEAPIIMLLAASTALTKDWDSYVKLRRFMMRSGFLLTAFHLLIALTPLYDVVVVGLIDAPAEIVEPSRIGLLLMTPWTWAIAYRRFQQGIMIRFDKSWAVGLGTVVRLISNGSVLAIGYMLKGPGIVVATCAISAGVTSEAIFSGIVARPVVKGPLKEAPSLINPLTFSAFMAFYAPLALTSLINLLNQPIGSSALSRMPLDIDSLAIWPIINGLLFMFRSPGYAYNEVVVALMDENRAIYSLRRVALWMIVGVTSFMLLMLVTPLAHFWLYGVMSLPENLAELAYPALWLALPMPATTILRNYYQGIIVHSRATRSITEAVVIYLVSVSLSLWAGVYWNTVAGIYVGVAAFVLAEFIQVLWLLWRSRNTRSQARSALSPIVAPASK